MSITELTTLTYPINAPTGQALTNVTVTVKPNSFLDTATIDISSISSQPAEQTPQAGHAYSSASATVYPNAIFVNDIKPKLTTLTSLTQTTSYTDLTTLENTIGYNKIDTTALLTTSDLSITELTTLSYPINAPTGQALTKIDVTVDPTSFLEDSVIDIKSLSTTTLTDTPREGKAFKTTIVNLYPDDILIEGGTTIESLAQTSITDEPPDGHGWSKYTVTLDKAALTSNWVQNDLISPQTANYTMVTTQLTTTIYPKNGFVGMDSVALTVLAPLETLAPLDSKETQIVDITSITDIREEEYKPSDSKYGLAPLTIQRNPISSDIFTNDVKPRLASLTSLTQTTSYSTLTDFSSVIGYNLIDQSKFLTSKLVSINTLATTKLEYPPDTGKAFTSILVNLNNANIFTNYVKPKLTTLTSLTQTTQYSSLTTFGNTIGYNVIDTSKFLQSKSYTFTSAATTSTTLYPDSGKAISQFTAAINLSSMLTNWVRPSLLTTCNYTYPTTISSNGNGQYITLPSLPSGKEGYSSGKVTFNVNVETFEDFKNAYVNKRSDKTYSQHKDWLNKYYYTTIAWSGGSSVMNSTQNGEEIHTLKNCYNTANSGYAYITFCGNDGFLGLKGFLIIIARASSQLPAVEGASQWIEIPINSSSWKDAWLGFNLYEVYQDNPNAVTGCGFYCEYGGIRLYRVTCSVGYTIKFFMALLRHRNKNAVATAITPYSADSVGINMRSEYVITTDSTSVEDDNSAFNCNCIEWGILNQG